MTASGSTTSPPALTGSSASWGELLGRRHGWRAVALTGGVAMHAINVHIVTTILPSVVHDIGGIDYYAWNVTLFVVTSIIGATLTSKLLQRLGARGACLLALAVFGSGAMLCAAAGDMAWMLAGRAVQGIGGGLLAALGYALIALVFEPRLWSRAIALVSGMWGLSTLLGPAVGGLFAASGHWRMAFFALLPLLLLQAMLVYRQLAPQALRRVDDAPQAMPLARILLLAAAVLLVALAGQAEQGWLALLCVLAGVALGLLLARRDGKGGRAGIRLLPRDGYHLSRTMGCVFAVIALLVMASCVEIFIPYFLQTLHGYAPLAAGYATAAMAGGWSAGSLCGSGQSGAMARRMIGLGPWLMALGLMALAILLPATLLAPGVLADVLIVAALATTGLGIGMGWPHLVARAMRSARAGEENLTSSAITTVQLVAMAMGAALAGLIANQAGLGQAADVADVASRIAAARSAAAVLLGSFALAPVLAIVLTRRLQRLQ